MADRDTEGTLHVLATSREEHQTRAMLDGQIHDVPQVVSVIELGSRRRGEYKYEWSPAASMATGIYTVSMQVNGRNVQRAKVVYVK